MTDLLPLQPPRQSRSLRTLERIVSASREILEEGGPEALTVQAIVERARSSVGSFYARFAGKEELLAYLGERGWREAALRWDEAVAAKDLTGLSLAELVPISLGLLGEALGAQAPSLRSLQRAKDVGEDAHTAFRRHVLGGVGKLLLARADGMSHAEPEVAVRLGLEAAAALLEGRAGEAPGQAIPVERRMEEAARLLLGYLAGERDMGAAPDRQVDFFDIWG
jgi:AcrR family transcriptional regulator